MPTYVTLANFTDQGIKNFRDTVRRSEDFRGVVEQSGGQVRLQLWTLGQYDIVVIMDFPDDETATAVALQTAALGNVRTTTLKAFDAEQVSAIIQRAGYRASSNGVTTTPQTKSLRRKGSTMERLVTSLGEAL
jgi:uncharacterized protein with GYD domain